MRLAARRPSARVRRRASDVDGVARGDESAGGPGVSVHTLRYYERAGLVVTTVERTAGGRRRYQQLDLDWIIVCTKLRATVMSIKTIRRYAQLVSAGPGNEQQRLALMEAHRAEVSAKLAELQENLKLITTRSTSTEAGSPPATPTNYGRPT